jgi:CarD family transcriptional regulator
MQFHVGDKIVHPHHGPGRIKALERKEFMDKPKRYFVIEIPTQGLTVYVPREKMEQVGVRLVMRRAKFVRVLATLRSRPRGLPEDYRERQEQIWEKLKTGRAIDIAQMVRDLTWHKNHDHLTKKDADYLRRGRELLAAEMALASDSEVADIDARIDAALATSLASVIKQERPLAATS